MYALFKDDKQISKSHSTREAVRIEALERGIVGIASPDFSGDKSGIFWPSEYKIKETSSEATK